MTELDDRDSPCPECEGTGWRRWFDLVDDGVVAEVHRAPCQTCTSAVES